MDDLKDANRRGDAPNPSPDSNIKTMIVWSILIGTVAYGATALAGDGGAGTQNQDIPFKLPPQSVVSPLIYSTCGRALSFPNSS